MVWDMGSDVRGQEVWFGTWEVMSMVFCVCVCVCACVLIVFIVCFGCGLWVYGRACKTL